MAEINADIINRLMKEKNVWIATVRAEHRPHLVPVWFVFNAGNIYICIEPSSVKGRNIQKNPKVSLALENGSNPVICEGIAQPLSEKHPKQIVGLFAEKYGWNIDLETQYTQLVEITPVKWLAW